MAITRLIFITIDPADTDKAMQVWKKECAPLMIQQKGCISERLLRSREAHEFISCSEWESETDIEMYVHSDAHQEIVRHTRDLKGAKAVVKLYEAVN
jgi:heme-degrading monooxygenase HmoA